jgi:hypothetical protein
MRPTRFEVLAVCSILDADVDGTPVREQQEMMSGLLLIEAMTIAPRLSIEV